MRLRGIGRHEPQVSGESPVPAAQQRNIRYEYAGLRGVRRSGSTRDRGQKAQQEGESRCYHTVHFHCVFH